MGINMKSIELELEVPGAGDPLEGIPDGHGVGELVQGASLVHLDGLDGDVADVGKSCGVFIAHSPLEVGDGGGGGGE